MRDKLIELIIDGFRNCTKPHEVCSQLDLEALADYLIANGVTIGKDNNVITNADRIRAMTDDELVEWLDFCPQLYCEASADCRKCVLNWLKQPVEKEKK